LSLLLGSSLTAIGAVGVAFVGLATVMGVSPAITAGAAVSGSIFGDKTAKISDTALLTVASVGGVTIDEHAKTVMRTAIPVMIISALLFLVLGFIGTGDAAAADPADVQAVISQYFNVSLLAFLPVVLIFVLSALKFSAYLCLTIPAIVAVILAAFTQQPLITALANDPSLGYFESVLKVGIDTFANGFHLNSGVAELDQVFSGGGTAGMLSTIWLILVAAAFGAVADYTGMLHRIITPVIDRTKGPGGLRLVTVLTSLGLNTVAADPYISIVLTSRMFRDAYKKEQLRPVALSSAIADSGTIFSGIIPWNVNGALFAATLGLGTISFAPFTFVAYLSPIITVIVGFIAYGKRKLPEGEDPDAVYGAEPAKLPAPQRTA
jgi:NhaC family Na+:H+ antiporter